MLLLNDDTGFYQQSLTSDGFEVIAVKTSHEALQRSVEVRPDIILADLSLLMDGVALIERLKNDPRTSAIPILAVTGYAPFQDPARAGRAGCDAIFPKPCDPDQLERALTTLIAEARCRRSA